MSKSQKRPDLPNELPAGESEPNLPVQAPGSQNELPDSNGSRAVPGSGSAQSAVPAPEPALERPARSGRSEGTKATPPAKPKRGRQGEGGGPKTPEGKARSSRNATKHGIRSPHPFIIQGVESPEEWDEFLAGFIESWKPAGMQEEELTVNVAFGCWKLRRCRLYENTLIIKQVREEEDALLYPDDEDDDEDDGHRSAGKGPVEERQPVEVDPEDLAYYQRLQLIPGGWTIDHLIRYDAYVRKTLGSDVRMLEVFQAQRHGERTPLARVEFNSGPSYARRTSNASEIPELVLARERVRLAEIGLAGRKLDAGTEKAGRG